MEMSLNKKIVIAKSLINSDKFILKHTSSTLSALKATDIFGENKYSQDNSKKINNKLGDKVYVNAQKELFRAIQRYIGLFMRTCFLPTLHKMRAVR